MAELMLVNPRRKKRGRKRGRRMSALQRQFFGPRRKRRRGAALRASPVFTRKSRRGRRRSRRMSFRRRGGLGGGFGGFNFNRFVNDNLMPAGVGAVGAIGVDIALGYIRPMLPTGFSGPMIDPLIRLGGAIGVGWLAGQVMGRRFGDQAMAGAITVVMYDFLKPFVRQMTGLPLSGSHYYDGSIGWISPAAQIGEYVGTDMGEYVGTDGADFETGGEFIPVG